MGTRKLLPWVKSIYQGVMVLVRVLLALMVEVAAINPTEIMQAVIDTKDVVVEEVMMITIRVDMMEEGGVCIMMITKEAEMMAITAVGETWTVEDTTISTVNVVAAEIGRATNHESKKNAN